VSLREEMAWWSFYLPRQAVQALARRLPLAELRDRLPRAVGERLRFGLYPARITDARAVECERRYAEWGDPAELDERLPVRFTELPRVSILVVTYNNLALTRLCLAAIQRAAGRVPFEVIVVDNQSTDGTPAWLTTQAQRALLPLEVALNDENRGFSAANNQGAAIARGEFLVFLNNDTIVTPGWLERLVGHLDADPSIGLIGPSTNSCGNAAEVPVGYSDVAGMLRFAEEAAGAVEELPMLVLFCAAMRRELWREIGGLDERYRVGMFEDDDLAMAVRQRDKRVVVARDVFVHHYGGAAFSRLQPREYLRIWWENRRRFEQKWGVPWQKR
jgi:GT2 family glycosyltransferase